MNVHNTENSDLMRYVLVAPKHESMLKFGRQA